MDNLTKLNVTFENLNTFRMVLGNQDRNIKVLNSIYNVQIFSKGEEIYIDSNDLSVVDQLNRVFKTLIKIVSNNVVIAERDIIYIAKLSETMKEDYILDLYK